MTVQTRPDVLAKQANAEEIKQQIHAFLSARLSEWSVDPDTVYITGVNNLEERVVIFSQTISQEAWDRVYENDAPVYIDSPTSGLFSVQYSFADEHRVAGPDAIQLGELMGQVVRDLG